MIKTLLKKQMEEIFRNYFYDAKKNKKRSPVSTILFMLFFVVIMVGVLGGIFTVLSRALCEPLVSVGLGWMYFTLMGLLAIFLGAFGSVFNTYSGLYFSKDNDLLLSLPIPVRSIMVSRLLGVYLMGLMYSAVVMIPAMIVYWRRVPFTAGMLLGTLMLFVLISVIVLILSCLLGWGVAKISTKLKSKSFITVLISLVFVAAYYFVYFKASVFIQKLLANALVYGNSIKGKAYPLYLFGCVGEGKLSAILLVTVVVFALFAVTWVVLSHSFLKIATMSAGIKKAKYKEKQVRVKSAFGAMLGKEFGRFTSSSNYMLNCGLGVLLLFAGGIWMLIQGEKTIKVLEMVFGARAGSSAILLCAALCMIGSMNDMAAPSVSLEGKNLWLPQSLPITPWQALKAKLWVQLILTGIPSLFCVFCVVPFLPCTPVETAGIILLIVLYVLLSACFALFTGVKMPNLTWTNEIAPIKQSMGVMLAMLGGWAYAVALAGIYLTAGWKIGLLCYLSIASLITLFLSAVLYVWLKKCGTKIFATL